MTLFEFRIFDLFTKKMIYMNEENKHNFFRFITEDNPRFKYLLWTGCYDSNGKKIYVGDILKIGGLVEEICFGTFFEDDNEYSTVGFYLKSKFGNSSFTPEQSVLHEIIGDIFNEEVE